MVNRPSDERIKAPADPRTRDTSSRNICRAATAGLFPLGIHRQKGNVHFAFITSVSSSHSNCLRKRHMPKPNNAAPSNAILSIEPHKMLKPEPFKRMPCVISIK
jgi:hypothetical protein